jgi:predicted nucleotidyltransferase
MIDIVAARAYLQAREQQRFQKCESIRQQALQWAHEAARNILPAFPRVRKAYLFGSVMHSGAMRRDSDIDIAIEGELKAEDYFALWREMERAIPGRTVEVVELGKDPHFTESVRQSGELIYARVEP